MTTQRMGASRFPSSDAPTVALVCTATILTIASAVLSVAAFRNDWPPSLVNFTLALMVLAWIVALERRRTAAKKRDQRTAADQIDQLERYLWNNR
ncbi:hypothetical protein F9C11_21500 [Amycolatopsis sp. VS8301801F10]|uniref:hypothetical protein n=1 Tax=Amycolatopsis sp. VS8301801F10 TaxID=2652442 RepID=UPI0038FBF1CA